MFCFFPFLYLGNLGLDRNLEEQRDADPITDRYPL